jgi:tetratricopeptide (TPR) repeat protein
MPPPPELDREGRLDEVIAAYLKAAQDGSAPRREALLDSHPDLAADLADFFADQDRIAALAAPLRAATALADVPQLAGKQWHEWVRDFGDYEILEEIARGGMGVVFKAWQKSVGRVVALKMLLAGPLASLDDLRRFRTEAESVARLDHPHIVPVYNVGDHDGRPYLSMKYLEGGSLARGGRRPPREAARLLADVADAVHYAHQRGVLHRDLKPANILLDKAERPYVSDFGLAKHTQTWAVPTSWNDGAVVVAGVTVPAAPPATQTGAVIGTPAYMAPEQAAGKGVTTAADVYGLGAVLYELLTGRPPFQGPTPLDVLRKVLDEEAPRPRALNPAVDRDLETICRKCLHKDTDRRYASAAALAADLRSYLSGETIRARPVGAPERLWRWARRQPVVAGLMVALAAALAAGFTTAVVLGVSAQMHYEDAVEKGRQLAEQNEALKARTEAETAAKKKAQDNEAEAKRRRDEAEERLKEALSVARDLVRLSGELEQSPGTQATRRKMLERALPAIEAYIREHGDEPKLQLELADTQFDLAMLISELRSDAETLDAFAKARDLYRPLQAAAPDDIDLLRKLGNSINNMGVHEKDLDAKRADFAEARRLYEQGLKGHPDDFGLVTALAHVLSNIGSMETRVGNFKEADEALQASVRAQQELRNKEDRKKHNISLASGLADAYQNLGVLYSRLPDRLDDALDCQQKACKLRKELADHFNDPRRKADYAASLTSVAIHLRDKGEKDKALKMMEEARDIREALMRENPGVPRYPFDLAQSYSHIGVVFSWMGDRKSALVSYEKARRLWEDVAKQDKTGESCRRELGSCLFNIGTCHGALAEAAEKSEPKEAAHQREEEGQALSQAFDLQKQVADADPKNIECRCDLANTAVNLGLALWRFGRFDDARRVLRTGAASARAAMDQAPQSAHPRQLLNDLWINLSLVERAAGRPADSMAVTLDRLKLCPDDPDELYRAALEFVAAVPLFGKGKVKPSAQDLADRGRCADLAVQTLRRAVDKGFADLGRLQKDREFDVLGDRDDFRALVAELEKKGG